MKVYTDAEYDRLYQETLSYEQIENNTRGFDEVRASKSQWDEGQHCDVNLSSGIKLEVVNEQILLDCHKLSEHCDRPILVSKFYLSGYHSVICPGIKGITPEYAETKGQNYLFYLPNIEEIEQFWQGDLFQLLRMEIDLAHIRNFATESNTVPKQLQALIEDKNSPRFHFNVGGITSRMQTILQQISQHPYQGAIAKMYLEGKVQDLLALQLYQLSESNPDATNTTLKNKNIDRIYQARDILLNRLENPPSISELTRQVGISDFTLRRGFQEIFGTTVIGYLTQKRLEQAELLLRGNRLSVAEVANSVGYTHLGYFAKVFKRQFGITPSECLAGRLSSE